LMLPVLLCAASTKTEILSRLNNEHDADSHITDLAILTSMHAGASDVKKIEPSLQNAEPRVRAQAIATLGAIGGSTGVSDLKTALLNDKDPGVRMAAAFWLGSLKDPSAISALDQALTNDTEANVRTQAAQALKTIGTSSAKSTLRSRRNDNDPRVKRLANE